MEKEKQENKIYEENKELEGYYDTNKNLLPQGNIICFPKKQSICENGKCEESKEDLKVFTIIKRVFVHLEGEEDEISRCDIKGCDTYKATVGESGVFINAQTKDANGMFLKIFNNPELLNMPPQKQYIEAVTLFLSVQITYGYCKEI